jgi:hypothetical protein
MNLMPWKASSLLVKNLHQVMTMTVMMIVHLEDHPGNIHVGEFRQDHLQEKRKRPTRRDKTPVTPTKETHRSRTTVPVRSPAVSRHTSVSDTIPSVSGVLKTAQEQQLEELPLGDLRLSQPHQEKDTESMDDDRSDISDHPSDVLGPYSALMSPFSETGPSTRTRRTKVL